METAPWGEELKEEKASISPPVRTWQTVPFVVGPTPPLPFPARCSPWQPFFQTRGAEPQQQQHLVSGELGSPGGMGQAQFPFPGRTWALAWLCVLAPLPLPVPRDHVIHLSELPSATSVVVMKAK